MAPARLGSTLTGPAPDGASRWPRSAESGWSIPQSFAGQGKEHRFQIRLDDLDVVDGDAGLVRRLDHGDQPAAAVVGQQLHRAIAGAGFEDALSGQAHL